MQWAVMSMVVGAYKRVAMAHVDTLVPEAKDEYCAAAGMVSIGVLEAVAEDARVSLVP